MGSWETLPGFRDFYPETCFRRNTVFDTWRRVTEAHGFEAYDGPVLEPLELYTRKSGEEIVEQLFAFTDKGGREVALRPEMTPTLARLIGSKAQSLKRPMKWYTIAENFRYERPSRGRLRSHYQLNADIYGEAGIGAEAELISLLVALFRAFGLGSDEVRIRLSDRQLWLHFLGSLGVAPEDRLPVLSIIDKMERVEECVSREALRKQLGERAEAFWPLIRELSEQRNLAGVKSFFGKLGGVEEVVGLGERLSEWSELLEGLAFRGIDSYVQVDLGIVRGLAYYTGFVFEAFEASGEGRALAGGGRYDELVEKLGGPAMPSVGFGFGDVMIELVLEGLGKLPEYAPSVDVYCVFSRDAAERRQMLPAIQALREDGFRVDYGLRTTGFGKQFKEANQKRARLVLICGAEEAEKRLFKLKEMASGKETEVGAGDLLGKVRDCLR